MNLKNSIILSWAIVLSLIDDLLANHVKLPVHYIPIRYKAHGNLHKEYHGGYKHANEHDDKGEFVNHMKHWFDWVKDAKGSHEKYGDEHHKKHGMDEHGEKHAFGLGGHKKNHLDEWKDKHHHIKDKGHGHVQQWDWHKEKFDNEAQGKKVGHDEGHHKKVDGDEHSLNKNHKEGGKKHRHNDHHAKKEWKNHGNEKGESGNHKKDEKWWEEKKPVYKEAKKKVFKGARYYKHPHHYSEEVDVESIYEPDNFEHDDLY